MALALAAPAVAAEAPPELPRIDYNTALADVRSGEVERVVIDPQHFLAVLDYGDDERRLAGLPSETSVAQLTQAALANDVSLEGNARLDNDDITITSKQEITSSWGDRITHVLPMLILITIFVLLILIMMRPFGREKVKPVTTGEVAFSDIGGIGEAVEELREVRDFLKHPKRFKELGARTPNGVLMYGPPGTGKTMMAKAIANEAGVPFFSSSGSDFVQMFVGLGALRVRRLFKKARKMAPAIIFIDEIDTLGGKRGMGGDGGVREDNRTLNALLKEMDGFEQKKAPLIIVGATNRLDHLDPALLRPGRFDRHIAVDPPDLKGRLEILALHARNKRLAPGVDLEAIARQTTKMAGADLENILNEAAIHAARRGSKVIEQMDLEDALVRVVAGAKKKNRAFSEEEKRIVSYHEAGHAIVGHRLGRGSWVQRISIIPRGGSGGQTFFGSEDRYFPSREELENELCTLLGGRAAEDITFGTVTTGASSDLQRASQIVSNMLLAFGMGETMGLYSPDRNNLTPDNFRSIEDEAKKILAEQYERAKDLLKKDKYFTQVAESLLLLETLEREEFLAIIEEIRPEDIFQDEPEREPYSPEPTPVPLGAPAASLADELEEVDEGAAVGAR